MTIAACYLSSEGLVLGADSTSTIFVAGPGSVGGNIHHYNFSQKVFEFGVDSTVGVVIWGLGSRGTTSYRTLIAEVSDTVGPNDALEAVATRWVERVWVEYNAAWTDQLARARNLAAKPNRTPQEDQGLGFLVNHLSFGFCFGGHRAGDRRPKAFEILFNPTLTSAPVPKPVQPEAARFWGCPNIIERMLFGIDSMLFNAILASDKWKGTPDDLFALVAQKKLEQPAQLPIREAIDWVHASIYATIKTFKFSHLPTICGGPIEIAVVSSDRPFRWVRHKRFDEAIA